jgi:hypothetical protein
MVHSGCHAYHCHEHPRRAVLGGAGYTLALTVEETWSPTFSDRRQIMPVPEDAFHRHAGANSMSMYLSCDPGPQLYRSCVMASRASPRAPFAMHRSWGVATRANPGSCDSQHGGELEESRRAIYMCMYNNSCGHVCIKLHQAYEARSLPSSGCLTPAQERNHDTNTCQSVG